MPTKLSILDQHAHFGGRLKFRENEWLRRADTGAVLKFTDLGTGAPWLRLLTQIEQGEPVLVLDPAIQFWNNEAENWGTAHRISLFSRPSKMAAYSFSLPAGTPAIGGTCPLSGQAGDPARRPICAGCYATGGTYTNPIRQLDQMIRKLWVQRGLAAGTLARDLTSALTHATGASGTGRARGRTHGQDVWTVMSALDPRYFRIHDTGDFGFGAAYVDAWMRVARHFRGEISFWAPTRQHTDRNSRMRKALAAARKWIVIRPSAAYFDEPPPLVTGLDGGTMSSDEPPERLADCPRPAGCRVWDCPAARHGTDCRKEACLSG
jgi:hypothetical protein